MGGRAVFVLAHAPWYEFWRRGLWSYAHWTQSHAPWWVWLLRVDFVVGAVLLPVFLLGISGAFARPASSPTKSSNNGSLGWFAIALLCLPGLLLLPPLLWLVAPFVAPFAAFVLLWTGLDRLTPGGRGRARIGKELERIGVSARVDGAGAAVRIALWEPLRVGSCKRIVGWRGPQGEALQVLAGLPSRCGQSVFFAAFKIAPGGGKFAKLASELDRLGVSEARARASGNTAWVEATYDPFGVTYTSPVLLMGEGQAWKDDPGAGKKHPSEIRFFGNLSGALAALEPLPDDVGPRGFWLAVGEPAYP